MDGHKMIYLTKYGGSHTHLLHIYLLFNRFLVHLSNKLHNISTLIKSFDNS